MEPAAALDQLHRFIQAIHPLAAQEWEDFAAIWQPFSAKRKTVLTTVGETEKYLYFVLEGIQRGFYIHETDKEATFVFFYPFGFAGLADSFLTQRPSRYFFETLTTSSFIRTTHQQLFELADRHRNIERLLFKGLSFTFAGVLDRQVELQCFSAPEKFKTLLKRSPHVLNLIPHKYLASYLGIDSTTFSKLLGSIRL
jgi:CRP-like cAMP-binding protein